MWLLLRNVEAKVRQYKYGIIVQTVGELEDIFDGEGMMETEARHKEYFVEFEKKTSGDLSGYAGDWCGMLYEM